MDKRKIKAMDDVLKEYEGQLIFECNQRAVSHLDEMPDMAKMMLIENLMQIQHDAGLFISAILRHGCDSPIEYIYGMALAIMVGIQWDEMSTNPVDHMYARSASIDSIQPQYEIDAGGKTYFADFLIRVDYIGAEIEGGQQHQDIVIECDGFEYHHATKEQVNHDNERELAIKKAGYDVLRFSGSQIYNGPFKCANDTIDYIISEMNRRCEEAS